MEIKQAFSEKYQKLISLPNLDKAQKLSFSGGSDGKGLPTMWKTRVQSLGQEDLLEKEMATHFSILAWKIPWMEEPGRLQSVGSWRVRHN